MLSNQGDKLASDVSVSLQFPMDGKSSPALPAEVSDAYSMDGPPLTTIKRTVSDSEKWRYVSYAISKLQSKSIINMAEVMQAPLAISVNLDEIDKRLSGTIQMEYALQIPVIVASGDDLDVRKISLSTIRANSLKDAQPQIAAFMKKRVSEQSNGDKGIFSAARWLNSGLPYEVFVLYPEDSTCDLNGPLTRTHMVKSIEYGA